MSNKEKVKSRAGRYLVGGMSSGWNDHPFSGPIYFKKSEKAYLYDIEGNRYIDYLAGHGSLLLGHNPKVMSDAIAEAFKEGFVCQYETEHHIELAEIMCSSIPCAEKVRLSRAVISPNRRVRFSIST